MGGNHFCLSQRKGGYKNASKRTKGCKRTKQQYRDMNLKRWANKTPKEALPIELDQAEDVAQLPNPRRRSREDMEEELI